MAATFVDYNGNQGTGTNNADFGFTFPSFKKQDVKVEVDNVVKTLDTHFTIPTYNVVSGGTVRFSAGNIPSLATQKIRIFRETDVATDSGNYDPKAVFQSGSSIKADDLNNNFKQALFAVREEQEQTIQTHEITDAAITTDKIKDDNVTLAKLGSGALPTDITVASANLVDGTIVNADVNASAAIAGTKISPDFGAQNIATTGTVDGRDVSVDGTKLDTVEVGATTDQTAAEIRTLVESASDSNVFTDADHSKLNAIEASATADQTDAEIRAAVEAASDSNVFTDADHSKLNNIEAGATTDQTASEIKTLLQSDKITDSEIATGTLDGRYFTETELTNGALDGRYFTETESDARYFNISSGETIKDGDAFPDNDTTIASTAAINDRIIDLVDDVGGFVPIANETSFPNTNPDVNNGTGTIVSISTLASNHTSSGSGVITISNGTVGNSTVTINGAENSTTYSAGYGLLVETTTTLNTYTFHRLVPKATEVTTVAGKATEIGLLGTAAVVEDLSILGTADVVADLAILGTNDVVADLNTLGTADVVADLNTLGTADVVNDMNVLGTSANVTAMDTCSTNISSINNCSTNISSVNNFGDKYQVASSNPSTDGGGNALAAGDLYFNTSANELKVYTGSTWQGGVTATGNFATATGNTFTGDNIHNDNVKSIYGTGQDLEIYHNGTNSHIDHSGTGDLFIRTYGGGQDLYLRAADDVLIQPQTNEDGIKVLGNAAVELYYDNVKKFETTSSGTSVTGNILVSGSVDGRDVAADGTKLDGIEASATADQTASEIVALVADQTIAPSTIDMEDNEKILLGNGDDLQIFHDGSHSFIQDTGTGDLIIYGTGEDLAKFKDDGSVELYYDGTKKFETSSGGATVTGDLTITDDLFLQDNLYMGDTDALIMGDSEDLIIKHDGTHSRIDNSTNYLTIRSNQIALQNAAGDHDYIKCPTNEQGVELYYDNSKKFETTSGGVTISGDLNTGGNDVYSGNGALIANDSDGAFANRTGSNIDHIWHNDSENAWNFCSDTTYKGAGNSTLKAANLTLTGTCTATTFSGSGASLTNIPAANITGTLPAIDGSNLTGISSGIPASGGTFSGDVTFAGGASAAYIQGGSDIRFESGNWTGESCKIQQHSNSLYIQGGSSTEYNIIFRAGAANTDRVYMANDGDFYPSSNSIQDLGKSTARWDYIYGAHLNLSLGGSISGVGVGKAVAIMRHKESHDVQSGTFSSGADRIRELNTLEHNGESFCSLNATNHEFTLAAGTYLIYFQAAAFDVNNHRAKIKTDGGTTLIMGSNARSGAADTSGTHSTGWGVITPVSTDSYVLAHRCQTSRADRGFGYENDITAEDEFYAQVIVFKMD